MPKRTLRTILVIASLAAGSLPIALASFQKVSVEDLVNRCDAIVLGRVTATDPEGTEIGPMKQLFTRHTLKVEAYYKGSGPEEVGLYTHGGFETDQSGRKTYTTVSSAPGVRTGEELVLFLKAIPEGYWIAAADGATYEVQSDSETGERSVNLRLRKKKYMRGATLKGFERLADFEEERGTVASGELAFGRFFTEEIPLKELATRLNEIVQGEALPAP